MAIFFISFELRPNNFFVQKMVCVLVSFLLFPLGHKFYVI